MSGEIVVMAMYGVCVVAFLGLTAAFVVDGLGEATSKARKDRRHVARQDYRHGDPL